MSSNFMKLLQGAGTGGSLESLLAQITQSTTPQPQQQQQQQRASAADVRNKGKIPAIELPDEDSSSDEDAEDVLHTDDPDLQRLEALTKKLASGEFANDILSDDDDDDFAKDDQEFRESLMREFRNLTVGHGEVPKARLKELYLQLLSGGDKIFKDRTAADSFLTRLNPAEMGALMDLMQKDPEETLRFFDNDEEVLRLMRNTPGLPTLAKGQTTTQQQASYWNFLDDDEEDDDGEEEIAAKRAQASEAVLKALQVFDADISYYAQRPDELLKISQSLPTPKEQNDFLDILFTEYTPEKIKEREAKAKSGAAAAAVTTAAAPASTTVRSIQTLRDVMDPNLVSYVFKEILQNFTAYRAAPHRFSGLTDRLNAFEKEMLDSLTKAFWDVPGNLARASGPPTPKK